MARKSRLNNIVITTSFVWLIVSFWNRNDLPQKIDYAPSILDEPVQNATAKPSFHASYDGVDYLVEPEYEYELYGMIVSYRHHDGESRMHRRANDHLNMLDVCVIWGDNTRNSRLNKISFWNGIFTCNVKTKDQAAWDAFDMYQLSNNHLISDDEFVRDQVKDIQVGDQIRVPRLPGELQQRKGREAWHQYHAPGYWRRCLRDDICGAIQNYQVGNKRLADIYVRFFIVANRRSRHSLQTALSALSVM